jgi:hypothetical protein
VTLFDNKKIKLLDKKIGTTADEDAAELLDKLIN